MNSSEEKLEAAHNVEINYPAIHSDELQWEACKLLDKALIEEREKSKRYWEKYVQASQQTKDVLLAVKAVHSRQKDSLEATIKSLQAKLVAAIGGLEYYRDRSSDKLHFKGAAESALWEMSLIK